MPGCALDDRLTGGRRACRRTSWKPRGMDYNKAIDTLTAGSAAANETHPLSDRDIEVYATNPAPLLSDDSWWDQLGEVLVVERLANPGWHPTRLVYYVGGKLDLTVIKAEALPTMRYERRFAVLVDKDGHSGSLRQAAVRNSLPDETAFHERLDWGYAAALMCAKAIVRDEPW
jgi:aminoglycoside 6-adenylyltransferase